LRSQFIRASGRILVTVSLALLIEPMMTGHADHAVSAAVARHAGLAPTADRAVGEVVWKRPRDQDGEALGVRGHY
jgi:hypothetical protein